LAESVTQEPKWSEGDRDIEGAGEPARELNSDERRILHLLLSPEFEGVQELRWQSDNAVVVGRCLCGCPTIDIDVRSISPPVPISGPLSPFEAKVSAEEDEMPGEIILFVRGGLISSMEYVYYSDTAPSEWPSSGRMSVIERPRSNTGSARRKD
jgi:hypothetical protein